VSCEKVWKLVDRILVTCDRDFWWAVMYTVIKLRFPQKVGKLLTAK